MNASSNEDFRPADRERFRERGLTEEDANRQLRWLRSPPRFARLDRPATLGDGILTLSRDDRAASSRLHDEAASEGRLMKFVPASGAATRMFDSLLRVRNLDLPLTLRALEGEAEAGRTEARAALAFIHGLRDFPFAGELRRILAAWGHDLDRVVRDGPLELLWDALLSPEGMGCAGLPKGLLAFHGYGDEIRTPFEEHLVEAAMLVKDASSRCRLHFTISPEHRERFRALLESARARYGARFDARYEVDFSIQSPSTDTLALELDGTPARLDDGDLLFRPSGHGALLDNLARLNGDIVLIKNIDNVLPDPFKGPGHGWFKALTGLLVRTQRRIADLLRRLLDENDPAALADAEAFCRQALHLQPERQRADAIRRLLDRPVRVCGMVQNTGEAGGGPFWVGAPDGTTTLQIVERAQVDPDSTEQQRILKSATHFNPVFMACGLRDWRNRPFDLHRFVDPETVIITKKSFGGREILALERPGLWNGAMTDWITLFVEVPLDVFSPVKTVTDLLRPQHQPAAGP